MAACRLQNKDKASSIFTFTFEYDFQQNQFIRAFCSVTSFSAKFLSRYHNLIGCVVSRIFKDHRKFYIGVFWNNAQKKVLICNKEKRVLGDNTI